MVVRDPGVLKWRRCYLMGEVSHGIRAFKEHRAER